MCPQQIDIPGVLAEQLRCNRHYLAPLGRAVHAFTFVSDASRLYELGETGSVRQVPPTRLVQVLAMAGNAYGDLQRQLLYQGLTRARSNIALVVYQNEPLLERLVGML